MEAQGLVPLCPQLSEAGGVAGDGWRVSFPLPQEGWCPAWELAWLWLVNQGKAAPSRPALRMGGREEAAAACAGFVFGFHLAAHTDRHREPRKPRVWTGLDLSAKGVRSAVS